MSARGRGLYCAIAVSLALGDASCATAPRGASSATLPPEAKDIDGRCTAAATLDDAHKAGRRILADVSDAVRPMANDGRGKWLRFHSDEELKRYAEENEAPNTQAWTWTAPDGTFFASMFFQSDSGDWSHTVSYCFRPDGTLARSEAMTVNYAADTDGSRTIYYATDGRVLLSTVKSLDSAGKQRATLDGLDWPPVYPTIKSLPFNAGAVAVAPPGAPSVGTSAEKRSPPSTDNGFDPNAVGNMVKSRLGAIKACYERDLKKGVFVSGRFVVVWTIDLAGTVSGVSVENGDPRLADVAACVVELIKRWRFVPAPKDKPIDVSFPFVFKSTQQNGTPQPPRQN
jgi:hypothetical protein